MMPESYKKYFYHTVVWRFSVLPHKKAMCLCSAQRRIQGGGGDWGDRPS